MGEQLHRVYWIVLIGSISKLVSQPDSQPASQPAANSLARANQPTANQPASQPANIQQALSQRPAKQPWASQPARKPASLPLIASQTADQPASQQPAKQPISDWLTSQPASDQFSPWQWQHVIINANWKSKRATDVRSEDEITQVLDFVSMAMILYLLELWYPVRNGFYTSGKWERRAGGSGSAQFVIG